MKALTEYEFLKPVPPLEEQVFEDEFYAEKKKTEVRRQKTCTRKVLFRSRAAAKAHIIQMASSKSGVTGVKFHSYRCSFCKGWHLTTRLNEGKR